ncbi:MAG: hypothetical protein ACKO2K_00320, partial [Alphaproteobacteria bacterium]
TITVYTDRDAFMAATGTRRESITTMLLDAGGRIAWRVDGPADPSKLESLSTALDSLSPARMPSSGHRQGAGS